MKKIQSLLLILLPAMAIFTACNGQAGYALKGNIAGAANLQVTLDQAHFDRSNVSLGMATADASGNFNIKQEKAFEEGLYRLSIGAKRIYFVLGGKEKTIDLKGDLNTFDKMEVQVTGSPTFTCYAKLIQDILKNQLKSPEEAKVKIQEGCTPLMQAFLTSQLLGTNAGPFVGDFKMAAKKLDASMPGTKYASDYNKMITQLEAQLAGQQGGGGEMIQVGQDAPDISLPDPSGKVRSLSSLKGKVVLLDFWASWCGPCRRENPHVVETYKKYKDKGFEVFSVSLDGLDPRTSGSMAADQVQKAKESGKERWKAAIAQDGLLWDNHVSDLQHWASAPAAAYGVSSIPKTFLIGRDGKIIAVNPRNNLEEALLKVL